MPSLSLTQTQIGLDDLPAYLNIDELLSMPSSHEPSSPAELIKRGFFDFSKPEEDNYDSCDEDGPHAVKSVFKRELFDLDGPNQDNVRMDDFPAYLDISELLPPSPSNFFRRGLFDFDDPDTSSEQDNPPPSFQQPATGGNPNDAPAPAPAPAPASTTAAPAQTTASPRPTRQAGGLLPFLHPPFAVVTSTSTSTTSTPIPTTTTTSATSTRAVPTTSAPLSTSTTQPPTLTRIVHVSASATHTTTPSAASQTHYGAMFGIMSGIVAVGALCFGIWWLYKAWRKARDERELLEISPYADNASFHSGSKQHDYYADRESSIGHPSPVAPAFVLPPFRQNQELPYPPPPPQGQYLGPPPSAISYYYSPQPIAPYPYPAQQQTQMRTLVVPGVAGSPGDSFFEYGSPNNVQLGGQLEQFPEVPDSSTFGPTPQVQSVDAGTPVHEAVYEPGHTRRVQSLHTIVHSLPAQAGAHDEAHRQVPVTEEEEDETELAYADDAYSTR